MAQYESSRNRFAQTGVLLVDDQKAARVLLRAFLVRFGLGRVEEASDSIEALRLMMMTTPSQSPFKAVFISRNIREMTGLELVRNIRQLTGWADFPVVVISEDLSPEHVLDAMSAGASDYLLRPYTEENLRSVLDRILK